ncbi:MAG: transposon-encoded TnpW family protein [Clostridia bacterium]|nr:transposon-encoded TnpW family protein [Clostridia bacterium]
MNTDAIQTTTRQADKKAPTITKRIGNTTFDIHVHFSETSKETFTDKVLRLIKNDATAEM